MVEHIEVEELPRMSAWHMSLFERFVHSIGLLARFGDSGELKRDGH